MFQEEIYCLTEGSQVVFYHIPHHLTIDIEITMSDMVAHALYRLPRNFGTGRQEIALCALIDSLKAFAYSLDQHTVGSQRLGAFGR